MNRTLILIATASLLVFAAAEAGQGKTQGKSQDPESRGQDVSDCAHRANERSLKGEERSRYLEWCADRGQYSGYDDRSWKGERNCYEKADAKGLSGDKRRKFLKECLAQPAQPDGNSKDGEYQPRGRDVLNKGEKK